MESMVGVCGIYGRCVWNPWDSVWNPWDNVWNPCGDLWNRTIPPGIHLEYGGRVNYCPLLSLALFFLLSLSASCCAHFSLISSSYSLLCTLHTSLSLVLCCSLYLSSSVLPSALYLLLLPQAPNHCDLFSPVLYIYIEAHT